MRNALIVCLILLLESVLFAQTNKSGIPWHKTIQRIPGRIECEFYNTGGEGVAYHDDDSINSGSGMLNPANGSFNNEFRMNEAVDISYTKSNKTDDNPFNKVNPAMDQLYVGWTHPGEWIKYTVRVKKTGTYNLGVMYTANGDGIISVDIDGKDVTGGLNIPSTHNDQDTVAWRQWHHWNKIDSLCKITLNKGVHILTLHTVANGNMNYDYLEFTKSPQN